MELLSFLRVLGRRPRWIWPGLVLAVAAFAVGSGRDGRTSMPETSQVSGFAQTDVLIDTRRPQIAHLRGGTEELGLQTMLLAALLTDDPATLSLAHDAQVPWRDLAVAVRDVAEPIAPTRLARSISQAEPPPRRYRVTVHPQHPVSMIRLRATAPTPAEAIRLAHAARRELAARTRDLAPSPRRRLEAKPLGAVRFVETPRRATHPLLVGAAAALLTLGGWCYLLALGERLLAAIPRTPRAPRRPGYTP